jgi:small subunit ribosomal protein S9
VVELHNQCLWVWKKKGCLGRSGGGPRLTKVFFWQISSLGAISVCAGLFTPSTTHSLFDPRPRQLLTVIAAGDDMASREVSRSLRRAAGCLEHRPRPKCERAIRQTQKFLQPRISRCISTTAARQAEVTEEVQERFSAAPPIDFGDDAAGKGDGNQGKSALRALRVVPASPSYFSAKPTFTDDFLSLSALLRKVAWKTIDQYRIMTNEPVKTQRFHKMLHVLRRLNCIHPSLMPEEVTQAMLRYKKAVQPGDVKPKPGVIDELGRAKGVGRRKTSSAVAWLVEGEGEALINGKSLSQFFGRLHHRESAVWALKATHRLDKYNMFGLVQGGGLTGQAEAMTLAVAKALLVHEPALKPALRRGKLKSFPVRSLSPRRHTLRFPSYLLFGYPQPALGTHATVHTCLGRSSECLNNLALFDTFKR